jgi:hypothetical protein
MPENTRFPGGFFDKPSEEDGYVTVVLWKNSHGVVE